MQSRIEFFARLPLIGLILAYRWVLSPLKRCLFGWGESCRYVPTCSAYALVAVERHGAFEGSRLTMRRFCRCHPWGGQGYDPVPACRASGEEQP